MLVCGEGGKGEVEGEGDGAVQAGIALANYSFGLRKLAGAFLDAHCGLSVLLKLGEDVDGLRKV